jgi:hypothetical protein
MSELFERISAKYKEKFPEKFAAKARYEDMKERAMFSDEEEHEKNEEVERAGQLERERARDDMIDQMYQRKEAGDTSPSIEAFFRAKAMSDGRHSDREVLEATLNGLVDFNMMVERGHIKTGTPEELKGEVDHIIKSHLYPEGKE